MKIIKHIFLFFIYTIVFYYIKIQSLKHNFLLVLADVFNNSSGTMSSTEDIFNLRRYGT